MFEIPIILNNFNRLTTTKNLANGLHNLGYTNIHILDNDSTYPPLLEWYKHCSFKVELLGKNLGQLAIYNSGYINNFNGWVAYSDSDIELNENCPRDFIEQMTRAADKYNKVKAGLALKINDLPRSRYGLYIQREEAKFWTKELEPNIYEADVDTTFSVIKVGLPFQYQAIRLAGDLTAKHTPWYLDYENLSPEELYIIEKSNSEYSTTKRFVDSLSLLHE